MTTKPLTLQQQLEKANPNELADALRRLGLGKLFAPIKVVIAGLTAAAAVDITSAAAKAAATITGIDALEDGELLPAIGACLTLRVTASGTAGSLGVYQLGDAGATPIVPPGGAGAAVGVATISDDGKTITFPNTVTGFVLEYTPRPKVPVTTEIPSTGL